MGRPRTRRIAGRSVGRPSSALDRRWRQREGGLNVARLGGFSHGGRMMRRTRWIAGVGALVASTTARPASRRPRQGGRRSRCPGRGRAGIAEGPRCHRAAPDLSPAGAADGAGRICTSASVRNGTLRQPAGVSWTNAAIGPRPRYDVSTRVTSSSSPVRNPNDHARFDLGCGPGGPGEARPTCPAGHAVT
jgi:hypothetical protein